MVSDNDLGQVKLTLFSPTDLYRGSQRDLLVGLLHTVLGRACERVSICLAQDGSGKPRVLIDTILMIFIVCGYPYEIGTRFNLYIRSEEPA